MSKKTNRSYLATAIVAKNSAFNNDFNNRPKRHEDMFFASDRAYKHTMRHYMEAIGEKVFIKNWEMEDSKRKIAKDKTTPFVRTMTNKELVTYLYQEEGIDLPKDFWEFADLRQFGMLYDGVGFHGVVQISQGINRFEGAEEYGDGVTSKMKYGTAGDGVTTAMNQHYKLTEAHYLYDVSVNPSNLRGFEQIDAFKEKVFYSKADYELLVEALLFGPRSAASAQRPNCKTGFLFQVDLAEGCKKLLGDLSGKITLENTTREEREGKVGKQKSIYVLDDLVDYLEYMAKEDLSIYENIVLMYSKNDIEIKNLEKIKERLPKIVIEYI